MLSVHRQHFSFLTKLRILQMTHPAGITLGPVDDQTRLFNLFMSHSGTSGNDGNSALMFDPPSMMLLLLLLSVLLWSCTVHYFTSHARTTDYRTYKANV